MQNAKFPTLTKVVRSEMRGYEHIRSQFANPDARRIMNIKLTLFTIFFSLIAFENAIRVLDFIMGWQDPIPPLRPDDLAFSSEYDTTFSAGKRKKLTMRAELGPQAMAQSLSMMFAMILNNTVWIRRKNFSSTWHTVHYFLAATFLVLYLPRHDLWPVM